MVWSDVEFRRKRAEKIAKAMLNKAWTQARLAEASGYDVRTIRNLLKGEKLRDQTIVDVCSVLGIEPEIAEIDQGVEVSEHGYGSYAREPYKHYEGVYFGYRRSFTVPNNFVRSIYEIKWRDDSRMFNFEERQSYVANSGQDIDYSQAGDVYISQHTDLIHLVTTHAGAVRMLTLRKLRGTIMRGTVMTQVDRDTFFQPCISAIYLEKIQKFDAAVHGVRIGPVSPNDADYAAVQREIENVEKNVMHVAHGSRS